MTARIRIVLEQDLDFGPNYWTAEAWGPARPFDEPPTTAVHENSLLFVLQKVLCRAVGVAEAERILDSKPSVEIAK